MTKKILIAIVIVLIISIAVFVLLRRTTGEMAPEIIEEDLKIDEEAESEPLPIPNENVETVEEEEVVETEESL